MNITPKRIDNLCRWHRNGKDWGLQLEVIRHFLFIMSLNCSPETLDNLNEQIMKIDLTLAEVKAYPPKHKRGKVTA